MPLAILCFVAVVMQGFLSISFLMTALIPETAVLSGPIAYAVISLVCAFTGVVIGTATFRLPQ